jgi:hypothetical protein
VHQPSRTSPRPDPSRRSAPEPSRPHRAVG